MRRAVNITVSVLISVIFVLLGVFVFSSSYLRFWETLTEFGQSIAFYFCEIFGIEHGIAPSVNAPSRVVGNMIKLPDNLDGFKENTQSYFSLLFSGENFVGWWQSLTGTLTTLSKVLVLLLPCAVGLWFVIRWLYGRSNRRHNRDTVPLIIFKFLSRCTYQPLKRFIRGYACFLREHGWIWKCWVAVWVFHFNLASILMGFLAYYFYFAVSFDLTTLYPQICRLFIDVQIPFRYFPYWSLLFVAWHLFQRWRRRIALSRLRRYEARNCGFINELPIVSITCGSMGKKKTTAITDMALSQEVMFRQKALEILQCNDMKFPFFPWIMFEKELQKCMEYGTVYNLATVKAWMGLKRTRFMRHHNARWQLYGYDAQRYGFTYDDALSVSVLFDVLETYAQAYFIYVIESSLIVANYSIRSDNVLMDEGNFPMWLSDFFPQGHRRNSRHAHILDFDVLRLGKKVIENNPNAGSFEFGVVAITEIGKERGNNLELQEKKKKDEEANQKNDLFNAWLKMCRHSATVDNFPFIKVFTDEQRPESWGADARDLCDIVNIASSSKPKLAYPFYTIEDMIAEWSFNRFINLYYDFRFRRGDNTLLVHILKSATAWIWKRNIRVYNSYGYNTLKIEKERGTMDGKVESKKYYIMNRKIYARRFSTDCFSDYFNDMARQTRVGLNDYREYVTEKASVDELLAQNSYFINGLYHIGGDTP